MEEPKKGGGLFGGGKPHEEAKGPSNVYMSQELSSLSTRMRVLEERTSNSRKKQQLIEQSMLSHRKKYSEEINILKDEMNELKRTMTEVENKIIMLIKELRLTAKKEDVDSLHKYVELWEPVKFATINQVENIVEEMIEEKIEELRK